MRPYVSLWRVLDASGRPVRVRRGDDGADHVTWRQFWTAVAASQSPAARWELSQENWEVVLAQGYSPTRRWLNAVIDVIVLAYVLFGIPVGLLVGLDLLGRMGIPLGGWMMWVPVAVVVAVTVVIGFLPMGRLTSASLFYARLKSGRCAACGGGLELEPTTKNTAERPMYICRSCHAQWRMT
ncbi:MAG: hypothetical protein AAGI53_17790 [Planctomycetota bacterium]